MRLNELANSQYEYLLVAQTPEANKYQFVTESGIKYVVAIHKGAVSIRIGFASMDELGMAQTGVTGTWSAIKVFSTVRAIILEYLSALKKLPKYIRFIGKQEGESPSRTKLYDKIVASANKWLPGYGEPMVSDIRGSRHYTLQKMITIWNLTKWNPEYYNHLMDP